MPSVKNGRHFSYLDISPDFGSARLRRRQIGMRERRPETQKAHQFPGGLFSLHGSDYISRA
jgi:hypothetical protein